MTPGGIGQVSYSSLYLSPLAWGYLYTTDLPPQLATLPVIDFLPLELTLLLLTGFTFLGAIQAHGIGRAVYGPDGPITKPKANEVQVRHEFAIIFDVDVEDVPVVPCRLLPRGVMTVVADYLIYRVVHGVRDSPEVLDFAPVSSSRKRKAKQEVRNLRPKHRAKTAYEQLKEIPSLVGWSGVPRAIFYSPAFALSKITLLSLLLLCITVYFGGGDYAIYLLILAHFILLFRKHFWRGIPAYPHLDSLDERCVAEYEKADRDEPRPRIRK